MNFELQVHGGFTGLSRRYSGQIDISPEEMHMLKEHSSRTESDDPASPDRESYTLRLDDGKVVTLYELTEFRLDPTLRSLIQKMRSHSS